jgi:hypothetical protein
MPLTLASFDVPYIVARRSRWPLGWRGRWHFYPVILASYYYYHVPNQVLSYEVNWVRLRPSNKRSYRLPPKNVATLELRRVHPDDDFQV